MPGEWSITQSRHNVLMWILEYLFINTEEKVLHFVLYFYFLSKMVGIYGKSLPGWSKKKKKRKKFKCKYLSLNKNSLCSKNESHITSQCGWFVFQVAKLVQIAHAERSWRRQLYYTLKLWVILHINVKQWIVYFRFIYFSTMFVLFSKCLPSLPYSC